MNSDELEEANKLIMDVMVGADGGVSYCKYISRIRQFQIDADNGDTSAKELLKIIQNFARLLEVITR